MLQMKKKTTHFFVYCVQQSFIRLIKHSWQNVIQICSHTYNTWVNSISRNLPFLCGQLRGRSLLTLSISLGNESDFVKRMYKVQECRLFPSLQPERYCWFQNHIYWRISAIMPSNPTETYSSFTFNLKAV